MKIYIKRAITYWYFRVKELTIGVNYVQGTRIPSDYPEYMWTNIGDGTAKYLSIEDQLKQLKDIYKDSDIE